jgi:ribonuclease R
VPISSLGDDFYRYEDVEHRLVGSSTGRVFRLGDRLRVKLVKADAEKRGLDFAPVGESGGARRASRAAGPPKAQKGRGRGPSRPSPAPPRGRTRRRR